MNKTLPVFEVEKHQNTLSNLNKDCTILILSKLDQKNLNITRLISNRFKKNSDSRKLYNERDFNLKKTFSLYNDVRMLINEYEKKNQKSWFHFFYSLVCKKFKDPIDQSDIDLLRTQSNELYANYATLKYGKERAETFDTIMSLFGGRHDYEALPILHTETLRDISRYSLNAPIMRGIDAEGRNFITIRYSHPLDKIKELFQVVHEYGLNSSFWNTVIVGSHPGTPIISIGDIRDLKKGSDKYYKLFRAITTKQEGSSRII